MDDIAAGFGKLWEESPAKGSRAVQLNLVLHFGRESTVEDALVQFRNTLNFAHRYPCRVVVLCPDFYEDAPPKIRAKIYGECFLGKSKSDMRCVEFVLLHYTVSVRQYLESQVSVCLSTDLPLYYWAHRFSAVARLVEYNYLLTRSCRVIFDSAVVPNDAFSHPWPNRSVVRDLAYTRTLPLRQNLGQFFSRYRPEWICDGLRGAVLRHRKTFSAEAGCLLIWLKKGFSRIGADVTYLQFTTEQSDCKGCLELDFTYAKKSRKFFYWQANLKKNEAQLLGNFGSGCTTLATDARLLAPEVSLGEAMFY